MARSSWFFLSTMVKNRTQFVKYQVQSIFDNTHRCVTRVVVAASSHSVFNHVRDRGMFFMIAWSRVPPHQNTPLQDHVTRPPFFCESSKFLSGWEMPKRGVLIWVFPFFVHRKSDSCCVFLGLPNVSFDQVRMLSHEQYCGECWFVESFFKHSVNRLLFL